jgi:mannose-6-phosphate isomerase
VLLLDNPIQNYAWGSRTRLAELTGRPPAREPEAELWIGAHPKSPSRSSDGRSLLEVIRSDPDAMLGPHIEQRFGAGLPFLLKVLAVEAPLSLQAHPDLRQARAGFAREEAASLPLDARERCYKDPNHKPELLCALTRFEALSGFRTPQALQELFATLGLAERAIFRGVSTGPSALRTVFSQILTLEGEERTAFVRDVLAHSERASRDPGPFQSSFAWASKLGRAYPGDVGAVASLLLNHVTLEPLEALYLDAGYLHAYLEGTGVEIMANSDNVLRGGLTPKHVDVGELLAVLRFDSPPMGPTPTREALPGEITYLSPSPEFRLSRLELGAPEGIALCTTGPELLLCVEGQAQVEHLALPSNGNEPLPASPKRPLRKGQACFLPASFRNYRVRGSGRVFRATVGN